MGRKKRVYPGNFPYQIKKKSLSHCQGFIQDFELGEGGTFMYLLREGGGRHFLKNRYSEIDRMHFGSNYSHSVLAHAQINWDSTF